MNNATLALNVAAPATSLGKAPSASSTDGATAGQDFGKAMTAAHVDASKPAAPAPKAKPTPSPNADKAGSPAGDDAPAAKAKGSVVSDEGVAKDDDGATPDDKSDGGDTSIAAAMLALIGVPPKAPENTPTPSADDVAGATASAAGLEGSPPLGADTASTMAGMKDGLTGSLGADATTAPVDAPAATTAGSAFASLLAAQAGDAVSDKDAARSSADPSQLSPMPLLHAPAQNTVAIPQVQATHPATSPQFAQELGEQIAWMGSGQLKEAQIKLHPEELGTMDVRVNLDGGKVNVAIMAQHPAAVHAVQQTLSQLDSMLAHHGLELGQADVGQRQSGQGGDGGSFAQGQAQGDGETAAGAPVTATSAVSRGLLDEVA